MDDDAIVLDDADVIVYPSKDGFWFLVSRSGIDGIRISDDEAKSLMKFIADHFGIVVGWVT